MDTSTASTIGTILGSAVFSFAAQAWGNLVVKKFSKKVIAGTAAQSTVDEIKTTVAAIDTKADVLVKQPGAVKTSDDRSPKGDSNA